MALGNVEELEHELIKRNRDIAKARDETSKLQQRLKGVQARNDDLLERVSALEAERNRLLAKLARLNGNCDSDPNSQRPSIIDCYASGIEELGRAVSKESTDNCAGKEVDKPLLELEESKAHMVADLEEERQGHASTRAALVDARLRSKQLEASLQEAQAAAEEFHAAKIEQLQLTMIAELDQAHSLARASECECEDFVQQIRDQKSELGEIRDIVEHLTRELSDHESHAEKFKLAKDEAVARHNELGEIHAESMRIATKHHEERLVETTQKIADLEGRIGGQRSHLDAAKDALTRCGIEEQSLAKLVQKQCDELLAERVAFETAAARRKEEASADLHLIRERFKSELATHESAAQTKLHSELDVHARTVVEAETTRLSLEAALLRLSSDHEEAQSYHCKAQEASRIEQKELRVLLSTLEAQSTTHQQNAESWRQILEDQRQEMEGRLMAQRLELETQQHAPLAQAELEKIHRSTMDEEDTSMACSQAKLRTLESELEEAKKRVAELEARLQRQTLDAEGTAAATLEGEIGVRHERQGELEVQLEPQRQHLGQLSKTMREWQCDGPLLIGATGSMNAASCAPLGPASWDVDNTISEVHSGRLQGRDSHLESLEEVPRYVEGCLGPRGDPLAAVEAELVRARQRCEQLTRSKVDKAEDIAEPIRHLISMEVSLQNPDAERERWELELNQGKIFRQTLESDDMVDVRAPDNERASQLEDFNAKLQPLGALLERERKERTRAERSFVTARQDFEAKLAQDAAERERLESEWSSGLAASHLQAERTRLELDACLAQIQSMQRYGDTLDTQRRDVEAALLSELSSTEAKTKCIEFETQRAKVAVEEGKAVLAQQRAMMTSCIDSLQMQKEVEDQLLPPRQCLERLSTTLRKAQLQRDQLIQTEGLLGAQFAPEMSPKGVIGASLVLTNQDVAKMSNKLEARLVRDQDTHREALAEVRRSVAHGLRRSADRLATVEAELVKARQCCDQLTSTKTNTAQDVGEHKQYQVSNEAVVQDHFNGAEGSNPEIDSYRTSEQGRESEKGLTNQDTRKEQIRACADESVLQIDDIEANVQRLGAPLEQESEQRATSERSLANSRQDLEPMQVHGDSLVTVDAELVQARQGCDQLTSSTTDTAQDLGEHKGYRVSTVAPVQDHLSGAEGSNPEIDHFRTSEHQRESEEGLTKQDTSKEPIGACNDESVLQVYDIEANVQRLDALLEQESEQRAGAERSLANSRQALEAMQVEDAVERSYLKNMLCSASAALCSQDEETRQALDVCLAQIQSLQNYADTLDTQRREVEATLQNEFSSTEAKAMRLESEIQRAEHIVDDCEDVFAQKQATIKSCMNSLERQHEVEGRLEAQRHYLEQLSEKLREAQADSDLLVNTKASLGTQPIQQNVMTASLELASQDAEERSKELEACLLSQRDAHREAFEEVQRSIADDLRLSEDCLVALEAELITVSQFNDDKKAIVKPRLAIPLRDFVLGETHARRDRKGLDIDMSFALAPCRSQGEEMRQLKACLARIKSMQDHADTLDSQRREIEATLRDELSSTEAKVRLLEIETQRPHTTADEGKAVFAEQQAAMNSLINSLERQLDRETSAARHAYFATGAAERERELLERLAMARDELATRILNFTLERQRLRGALDESRRTLQGSLEMPVVGVEKSVGVGLEQKFSDESRKSLAAALQRGERTLAQLESLKKRHDDLSGGMSPREPKLERRAAALREQWQRAKLK